MKLDPEDIRRLARFTVRSKPDELTCDEWVHLVGEFVEAERAQVELKARQRLAASNVEGCPACAQELEALHGLLEPE